MKLSEETVMFCGKCTSHQTFNYGMLNTGAVAFECKNCGSTEVQYACCEEMQSEVRDSVVVDFTIEDGYHLVVDDDTINTISFCPWCGAKIRKPVASLAQAVEEEAPVMDVFSLILVVGITVIFAAVIALFLS